MLFRSGACVVVGNHGDDGQRCVCRSGRRVDWVDDDDFWSEYHWGSAYGGLKDDAGSDVEHEDHEVGAGPKVWHESDCLAPGECTIGRRHPDRGEKPCRCGTENTWSCGRNDQNDERAVWRAGKTHEGKTQMREK